MPDLAAPAWLLGLLLAPLVYRLHRLRAQGRPVRVPAIFLWREGAATAAAGPRIGPPDPAWRRRALLVALLALALAGPVWTAPGAPAIALWLDDGPALFAREAHGATRLEAVAAELAQALEQAGARQVTLYALHRPGAHRELSAWDAAALRAALRDWLPGPGPFTPPPSEGEGPRWLVSSGADPRVRAALAGLPFQRTFPIGRDTENLALIRLAVRPSAAAPERLDGLVELLNAGRETARRTLELRLAGAPLTRWDLELAPGERLDRGFALPAGARGKLDARLLPAAADALPLDDALGLDLADLNPLPYAAQGDCGRALETLLLTHPGLRSAAPGEAKLAIRCGATPPPDSGPTLWLVAGTAGGPLREAPVWSGPLATAGAPRLQPAWVHPVAAPQGAAGEAILAATGVPLILEQVAPPRIAVLFALDQPELSARPELPALLALLLERLAGWELLLPTATTGRDPAAAAIAPGPLPVARAAPAAPLQTLDAAPWALATALLLALYDLYRRLRPAAAR